MRGSLGMATSVWQRYGASIDVCALPAPNRNTQNEKKIIVIEKNRTGWYFN